MNIDATLTLIPVKTVRQPALAIKPKTIAIFRRYHSLHKTAMAPLEYSHNDTSRNNSLYGSASQVSVVKGTIIDIFA